MAIKFFALLFFVCAAQAQLGSFINNMKDQVNAVTQQAQLQIQDMNAARTPFAIFTAQAEELVAKLQEKIPANMQQMVQQNMGQLESMRETMQQHVAIALAQNLNIEEIFKCLNESGAAQKVIKVEKIVQECSREVVQKLKNETKESLGPAAEDIVKQAKDAIKLIETTSQSALKKFKEGKILEAIKEVKEAKKQLDEKVEVIQGDIKKMGDKAPTLAGDAKAAVEALNKEIQPLVEGAREAVKEAVESCLK